MLRFSKAVIATGARAFEPPVEGLKEAGFLTNETVFSLTKRPRRLAVFGAGPLGCELAQAFNRLGCKVTIIQRSGHFLRREDPDAAEIIAQAFRREGIEVMLNTAVDRVSLDGREKVLHITDSGRQDTVTADEILIGAGRAPNVGGLNLEAAGVRYFERQGVIVDDHLRTTNKRIFAAGDVCLKHKFTHTADASARIVIQNALFKGRKRLSDLVIPWCTYTDPAIAHVGMYEADAQEAGIEVDTFVRHLSEVDRAITDGQEEGMVKVHVRKGTDRILGATIVAERAGDMISEITLAMVNGIGLKGIAKVIHPYPTQAEAIKQIADEYNRTRLTPRLKSGFKKWLALTR
jgi:pyruvate/2-oxoglutarate dehydrogenase complex dihydrolipoamide dehydrogenase (E3) component